MANAKASKLANLIDNHPRCAFNIDNDCWNMTDPDGKEIASSTELNWTTEWYGHSSNYGAGIAEAIMVLLNRRGFDIDAHAV